MRLGRFTGLAACAALAGAVLAVGVEGIGAAPTALAGGRIAFSRGLSPERYEIWTMTGDGRDARALTHGCGWDWFPTWSPNGRRLAFTRACGQRFSIYVVNSNGSGLRRVTPARLDAEWPSWSPDGRRLAFAGGNPDRSEIYIVSADGHDLRQLTHNQIADSDPDWSPDGRTILFTSSRAAGGHHQLMLISPTGGSARALPMRGGEPAWSPDGKRISWARAEPGTARETDNIWVANADGSQQRRLTHERIGVASHHPTWSPDGRTIAFMSSRGSSIWQINLTGGGLRRITHAYFEDADPAWRP
jgi:TolB protein